MLDAAAHLIVDGGPAALSAAGVARSLSAPSGSVYHRFPSRDHLGATLWLRTVERFDTEVVSPLAGRGDPVVVAVATARRVVDWCRENPVDASILTTFRREDLVVGEFPAELAARAQDLGDRQRAVMEDLARRLDQPLDLVRLAVAHIPHAAVRGHIRRREPIPPWVAGAVERAVRAVLTSA